MGGVSKQTDIQDLVSELRVAAIDAYMAEEGYQRSGSASYTLRPLYMIGGQTSTVTPPDTEGYGGGQATDTTTSPYTGIPFTTESDRYVTPFSEISQGVTLLTRDWHILPNPEAFDETITTSLDVEAALNLGEGEDAASTSSGRVGPLLELVDADAKDGMNGETERGFREFLVSIDNTVQRYHAMAVIRGAALTGVQEIWRQARLDLHEILNHMISEFRLLADAAAARGWQTALKVAGTALKGAQIFAGDKINPALKLASLGIEILESTTVDTDLIESAPDSYPAAMTEFQNLMNGLNATIHAEEVALYNMLTESHQVFYSRQSDYNMDAPTIVSSDSGTDVNFSIDEDRVVSIIANLRDLSEVVTDIGSNSNLCFIGGELLRSSNIGLASTSIESPYNDVTGVQSGLLRDLAWEMDNGATHLEATLAEFGEIDGGGATSLEQSAENLEGGSPYDPYHSEPEESIDVDDEADENAEAAPLGDENTGIPERSR
ncbi:hypothetical protein ACT3TB_15605 [Micrococcaceae sp. AOP34-BR2-30]